MIYAVDPGTTQSALVQFDADDARPVSWQTLPNIDLVLLLRASTPLGADVLVVEQIAAMGMAVGAEVFETCMWSGRFVEAWDSRGGHWTRIKRVPIKAHLCGVANAKDANIRRALMDRFGGDASVKKGGPLYKVAGDQWAALAVACTYYDLHTPSGQRFRAPASSSFGF